MRKIVESDSRINATSNCKPNRIFFKTAGSSGFAINQPDDICRQKSDVVAGKVMRLKDIESVQRYKNYFFKYIC